MLSLTSRTLPGVPVHEVVGYHRNWASSNTYLSPDRAIGFFARPEQALPIINPDAKSVFDCPMQNMPIHREATHMFNPASMVRDGAIYLLYRAEGDSSTGGIGLSITRVAL